VFSVNIDGAVNRVPAIEQTGIKSTVCGPGMYAVMSSVVHDVAECKIIVCMSLC